MGICIGTTLFPKTSLSSDSTLEKFAFSLSILLIKNKCGIFLSSTKSQAFSVPTSIPETLSTAITALSLTFKLATSSPTKSKYPGVSMAFILTSFQSHGATAALIEILLFISSWSKSVVVLPSSTFPNLSSTPVLKSIASAIEVLPELP